MKKPENGKMPVQTQQQHATQVQTNVAAEKIDKFVGGAGVDVAAGRAAGASSKGGCFGRKGMCNWVVEEEVGNFSQTLPVAILYYCRCCCCCICIKVQSCQSSIHFLPSLYSRACLQMIFS